mmetsp:Transcript_16836/g.32858  ORF Transcript_16836/g.32858 Transcript_16836/m.32858 type:complete len:213 (-) Transcript_16836:68-706(-)|eukprot:CAMPEP_0175119918 /NCGR_PEP_ID=MMETSP0087-20121206/334_1 /TAXON_ID=136419 /ORGANISM="Unknown Unknown, Strain D1" /LENGTH=212 /DNA_ID=CAMNT_0016401311 /DNA_START=65 /DNA_END=700 /DNA_ORIENTATION=+
MDGLMIDSEPMWHIAEKRAFGPLGVTLSDDDCLETTGLRIDQVVEHNFSKFGWDSSVYPLAKVTNDIIQHMAEMLAKGAVAKPGLKEAIAFVQRKKLKMAVATSSATILIDAALGYLELKHHFSVFCSAEKEEYGKPHPAVYISAAKALGVDPTRCLAFEDSLNGVLAAKAARMKCIAVPEETHAKNPKFVIADKILTSLEDLNESVWHSVW